MSASFPGTTQPSSNSLSNIAPVENHLPRVPRAHRSKSVFIVPPVHPVRNDARNIQPTLKHHGHLVPGLIHLPPVDPTNRKLVEHHLVPINRNILRRNSQHCDLRP